MISFTQGGDSVILYLCNCPSWKGKLVWAKCLLIASVHYFFFHLTIFCSAEVCPDGDSSRAARCQPTCTALKCASSPVRGVGKPDPRLYWKVNASAHSCFQQQTWLWSHRGSYLESHLEGDGWRTVALRDFEKVPEVRLPHDSKCWMVAQPPFFYIYDIYIFHI